jgi:hypothetical protein
MEQLPSFPDQLRRVCEIAGIPNGQAQPEKQIVATYDYDDEDGQLLFQVVRYEPKDFRQRRPDGYGGWLWNMAGVRRVLFKLRDVRAADFVLIVEGEEDVLAASRLGLPPGWAATTNPGGALKWRDEYSTLLKDKIVIIWPDADEAGTRHLHHVAASVLPVCRSLSVVHEETTS